jgi:hypothetical protein
MADGVHGVVRALVQSLLPLLQLVFAFARVALIGLRHNL